MKQKEKNNLLFSILTPLLAVIVLLCFLTGISNLSKSHQKESLQQVEEAIRRAAVACYAAEGIYPPNIEYLTDHYGIQIDESRYFVDYNVFAENLMPDITVLEKNAHE